MSKNQEKPKRDNADREEWTDDQRETEHKIRMRFEYRDLVEELIQDGQERGVFDNLQGKGKPLDLESNLYAGDNQLANELMKEHDVVPLWLARRNSVSLLIDELRQDIGHHWRRHEQVYRLAQDKGRRSALRLSWSAHCRTWQGQIEAVNKHIDDYNLRRPSKGMELFKLRLEDELQRAGAARELV